MSKKPIDQFKDLIRECVRDVIREELQVLSESNQNNTPVVKRNLQEDLRQKFNPDIHEDLRTHGVEKLTPITSTGNPMLDMLNETKQSMGSEDFQNIGSFGASDAPNFGGQYRGVGGEVPVGNTGDMLNSSRKSNDINQVSIDVVPDYSSMMKAMNT